MKTCIPFLLFLLPPVLFAQYPTGHWQPVLESVEHGERGILMQGWQWIEEVRKEESTAREQILELNHTLGRSTTEDPTSADYPGRMAAARSPLEKKLEQAHAFFYKNLRSVQQEASPASLAAFYWEYAQLCTGDLEILKLTFLEAAVAIAQRFLPSEAPFFETELAQRYTCYGMDNTALQLLLGTEDAPGINRNWQMNRLAILGRLYLHKGDYQRALPHIRALTGIAGSLYAENQLPYQEAVEILLLAGDVFAGLENWEQARLYYEKAEALARDRTGSSGPNFLHGKAYGKAAKARDKLGDPSRKKAFEQLYSAKVVSAWLAPPDGQADSLFIATLLYDMNMPEQAAQLIKRMDLRAQEKDPLCQYLSSSQYLTNLRQLFRKAKEHGETELLKKISYDLVIDMKSQVFYAQEALSNYALSELVAQFREDFRQYQISNLLSAKPDMLKMAATWHYAGSEINNLIRNNEQVGIPEARVSADPFENGMYREWTDLKRNLTERYSGGYLGTELDIFDMERRLIILENCMRLCQVFLKNPTPGAVFGKIKTNLTESTEMSPLKKDEAIVEFVRIPFNGKNFDATSEMHYYALTRRNVGDAEELEWDEEIGMVKMYTPPEHAFRFTFLFKEEELKMVIGGNSASVSDGIAALYQARGATALNAPGNADLSQLYRLIWQPLEPGLEGIGKVYYTKSGLLNQISMAALPTPAGELLAARFELFTKNGTDRLSIEREREALHAEKPGAVFYGGIDFDVSEQEGTSEKDGDLLASNSRSLFQDAGQRAGTTPWSYLEGTRKEVEQLTTQFRNAFGSLQRFEGAKATEASFKKVGRGGKSPDLLHIATHGFFLPEKEKGETGGPGFGNCENPLIRSGLLMAGGNLAWTGAPPTGGQEDGILTAYEIAMLDLKHTKLAVLSACETGLGELAGAGIGEEVHGLQRAFKLAGVEYVIMSLWKIPDAETVVFMNTFYNKWLSGAGVRQAFRATQLELSETYPPYAWAAFVLIN